VVENRRERILEQIRLEHKEASHEHTVWKRDVENWRASYEQALSDCFERLAAGLELENFEAALDRHEAAIEAHEESVRRHEKALGLGGGAEIGLSDDSLDFHKALESRHALSRASHKQLGRTHRAILAGLEMLGRR
jgi:hypothetical protein